MAKSQKSSSNVAARNRKARHNYFIESTLEAGLVLFGTEVKSLRNGRSSIEESYATEQEGELYLVNSYIPSYDAGAESSASTETTEKDPITQKGDEPSS